jgi:hypothetical protein
MSDQKPTVRWILPRWAAELILETIELDSQSAAFDSELREQLSAALGEIKESEPGKLKPSTAALAQAAGGRNRSEKGRLGVRNGSITPAHHFTPDERSSKPGAAAPS